MRTLKNLSLGLFVAMIVVLAVSTLIDPLLDTQGLSTSIYGSWWFALLWFALAVSALLYIVRRKLWRLPSVLLLHVSFLVILAGALTTRVWGQQGTLHLRQGEAATSFTQTDGTVADFPFEVRLDTFRVTYYQATMAAQDYISTLSVGEGEQTVKGQVSMNKVFSHQGYRFYQSGYDPDMEGSRFAISHDPWGIRITYTGYLLLLISMVLFFFQRGSLFRKVLKGKAVAVTVLLLACATPSQGSNTPRVAPTDVAEMMGDLYIHYNGRVCPLQTFAKDFTTKLYGKSSYRGRTSDEILAGWLFFPNTWKPEPMIRVKGGEVKRLLGVDKSYVSLLDFANVRGEYKLSDALTRIRGGEKMASSNKILEADEKISIINSVFTGSALKIFPVRTFHGNITWFSSIDDLPDDLDVADHNFIRKQLNLIAESIMTRRYTEAKRLIGEIKDYQRRVCGMELPTNTETQAEKAYNSVSSSRPWSMACTTIGIVAFIYFAMATARGRKPLKWVVVVLNAGMAVTLIWLTFCMVLRAIISHHLPLSNGFETMQAMAWICFVLTLSLQHRRRMLLPFSYIVGGLALMVAMIGESNPVVTNLMPVLNSPLLSVHVMVIMIAYALLAFIMLNGITALCFARTRSGMAQEVESLRRTSLLMLYPAVFLLAAGIFIGAVWANVSWGRYWGWDPKEVWALITLMIYALPLHGQSIRWFGKPLNFHRYCALAFLAVAMTYFGVNYFLTGMHSYA